MKSTVIWSLVGLNLLLAAIVVAKVMPISSAQAQAARRPSDYLMIPGQASGLPYTIVYVVDVDNGILGGMAYDETKKIMQTMPAIDLNRVFGAAGGAGGGAAPAKGGGYK